MVSNTWRSHELYQRESATWADVFSNFDSYLGNRSANRIVIATRSGKRVPVQKLISQMQSTQNRMQFEEINIAELALSTLDSDPAWAPQTPLLTDDFAPVNLLIDPRQGVNK